MSQRRALLIGSQTHGLAGPDADVERMRQTLGARQFTITSCTGPLATRDGILAAYERLISEAESEDAVCLYYSGHGGRAANPYPGGPRFLQYLVPTDHTAAAFRGVMSFELSALLAQLTLKTQNVTVILDCCHAGQMSRASLGSGSVRLVPKVLEEALSEAQVESLLEHAQSRGAVLDPESNPNAVRLMATEPHVSAYEEQRGNEAGGIFTQALLSVLAERGERRASWGSVMLQARERVMQRKSEQRPDVEGPRRRLLFDLEQLPDERPLPVFFEGNEARLRAGSLFGALPDARFGLMRAGSETYDAASSLGDAVVTQSLGSTARLELHAPATRPLPTDAVLAFPLSVPFRRCAVGLDDQLFTALSALLSENRFVRAEPIRTGVPSPTISRLGSELVLRDAGGVLLARAPVVAPTPLLDRLECLARAEDLRAFDPGKLETDLEIELGRVQNGQRIPMSGQPFHVGDRQYISVANEGNYSVFVAVLGIDPYYTVRLLTRRAPRGHWLRAGQALLLGQAPDGTLQGVTASFPQPLAVDEPLLETIIVIAADEEQDFSLLTTSDAYDLKLRAPPPSLSAEQARGQRGLALDTAPEPRSEYALLRRDYQLDPRPRS